MKKQLLVLIFMLCIALSAQDYNAFVNLRHSSRDPNGKLHLRWEALNDFSDLEYETYYTTGGIWQAAPVSNIGSYTKEALIPYTFGQRLRYRLKTYVEYLGQTVSYMQPAYLDGDSFPLSIDQLALMGEDAVGDSLMIYSPVLDLTDSYVASSANRLYRSFGTQAGTFGTSEGFTTYNLYVSMIANPASVTDSLVYAMVYCSNVLGLISPGLYKLGLTNMTPDFSRIGDIQSQVSGGILHMSCAWDAFTQDPDFGDWPNALNSLVFTDLTMRVSIDLSSFEPDFKIADIGAVGMILFEDNLYQVAQNTVPWLQAIDIDEASGLHRLLYQDVENDFPLHAYLSVPNANGGYTDTDIEPIYRLDGSIEFEEILPVNSLLKVSDNLMDYYVFEGPVSSQDELLPAARLQCQVQQTDGIKLIFSGLEPTPLKASLYNIKGQKLFSLPPQMPRLDTAEYSLSGSEQARLTSGIYLLKYGQNSRQALTRFVYLK